MTDEETPLGTARRVNAARLRSAWEGDYQHAILAARRGNVDRLVDCLQARKPMTSADYDALAQFISAIGRRPGSIANGPVHEAAKIVLVLKDAYRENYGKKRVPKSVTDGLVEQACQTVQQEFGDQIDPESVQSILKKGRITEPHK